jgi:predicted DNA-binding ribbon-helix-helix protein
VTNPHEYYISIDLEEITARNETARHMITGFAAEMPPLADFWRFLEAALADTPALSAEIGRLAAELATARRDVANLLAAMRATLTACADGETDPLWYLRDELNARQARSQGHGRAS